MTPAICIEMLYPGRPTEEKIRAVADHGFHAIEFWSWRDKDLSAVRQACEECGVVVSNFSGHRRGSPVADATHHEVLSDLNEAAAAARRLRCDNLMFLSNELGEGGRVTDDFPSIARDTKIRNFEQLLRRIDKAAPAEIQLLIEPLNTVIDHPGCFLSDMETASLLLRNVESPRLKTLCDLYHMAVMDFDLEELVGAYAGDIGYVHVADVPGRHEPGTGTIEWDRVLAGLQNAGYDGWVGFEYEPHDDTDQSLEAIRELWDRMSG